MNSRERMEVAGVLLCAMLITLTVVLAIDSCRGGLSAKAGCIQQEGTPDYYIINGKAFCLTNTGDTPSWTLTLLRNK